MDKQSVIKGEPIGAHDDEELATFLENLQRYIDAAGVAIGVGPLDFCVTAGPGDVTDLIVKPKRLANNSLKLTRLVVGGKRRLLCLPSWSRMRRGLLEPPGSLARGR